MNLRVEGSEIDLHEVGGVTIHVVKNRALERLLFNRNLLGKEFRDACFEASTCFVRHLADEYEVSDTAELLVLSKGLVYQLSSAVSQETGSDIPTNLIATSRIVVAGHSAKVSVTYSQLEAPARTLLIGDTVASGATIVESLKVYLAKYELERVYVLSYAGTGVGAQRIARFCRQHSVECVFLYGLAVFGLGDNGFDLSFLHPDTIADAEHKERARAQFGGHPVSAVGWDFGSQAMAPRKYRQLCWIEAELWGLHGADCFTVATKPPDLSDLMHEWPAYAHRYAVPARCRPMP